MNGYKHTGWGEADIEVGIAVRILSTDASAVWARGAAQAIAVACSIVSPGAGAVDGRDPLNDGASGDHADEGSCSYDGSEEHICK